MRELWELRILIDRGFYGSHIKNCLGRIKGVGVSSGLMRSFFFIFFFSILRRRRRRRERECARIHFAVARGGDLFFRG